ncbi:MAG: hypothetical protein FD134_1871 [Gallionellaceae bacterium]|nr:MAG: hypothetical protein FD134_1871 [Gallionellaceae bacterium]
MEEFPGPVGWAMAAVQAAMGFAEVAAIQGTQFGGGSGGGSGGSAASAGGGIPSLATTPGVPVYPVERAINPDSESTRAPQQFNLTIVGAKSNPDAPLLSYNAVVNDLLPLLERAANNGHGVNFRVAMA